MGIFSSKKDKLMKKYNKINNRYLDMLDEYDCTSCKKYNSGNIIKFSDRFAMCTECPHYAEMLKICNEMDAILEEKEKL